ncbi:MAG: hypothetical protein K2P45_10315 [Eubacterium sp.]|nr:hypothetical protein [Eubacterium sp.]
MKEYLSRIGMRRIIGMVVGNLILGIGIAVFRTLLLGNDPYSAMMMAGADHLPISYGTLTLIVNAVFFIAEFLWGKHYIGIGTFANWFLLGYIASFFIELFSVVEIAQMGMAVRLATVAAGVLIVSIGVSLYQSADLGIAPYDSLSMIMKDRCPLPYFWCRLGTDVICTAVCFALGGIINIGTAVCAFGLGPFIHFFDRHISLKLLGMEDASHI